MHWALLRPEQYGWALDADWEKHLDWQTRRIAQLEGELRQADISQQQIAADHERELADIREQLAKLRAQEQLAIREAQAQLADSQKRIRDLDKAWNTAKTATQQYQRANAKIRDALKETWWGPRFLKRFDKPQSGQAPD